MKEKNEQMSFGAAWAEVERMVLASGRESKSFHMRVEARNTFYQGKHTVTSDCAITVFEPCKIVTAKTWDIAVEMLAGELFPVVSIADIATLFPETQGVAA